MVSELSFLIDLLINPRSLEQLKKDLAERIKQVEENFTNSPSIPGWVRSNPNPLANKINTQAPSTIAALARHGEFTHAMPPVPEAVVPVEQIAQTPQTAAAMQSRQIAIAESIAGKVDKVTGRPKKW